MNLLSDPIFGVRTVDGEVLSMSLPATLQALSEDAVETFTGLRPHQKHAFHAFLSQLGAMAVHSASAKPNTAAEWADAIRLLSPAEYGDAPWDVVGDVTKPAFMQIPAPEADTWRKLDTNPDDVDVLISSKNHEVKQRWIEGVAEQWVMALISSQTSIGFTGPKCYGIFRMNGGLGSRSCYGIMPAGGVGAHVMRDIKVLIDYRETIIKDFDYAADGHKLMWIPPWDGKSQLAPREFDPYAIEIARRLRLVVDGSGAIVCRRETTDTTRVIVAERGLTGDPWAPVTTDKGGEKALTIAENPFGYDRIVRQLFGKDGVKLPIAMKVRDDDGDDLSIVLRGLVRGQGKTAGYHERLIPISRKIGVGIRQRSTDPVAQAATDRARDAGEVAKKLKFAALALQQNGAEDLTWDRKTSAAYASGRGDEFSTQVDRDFFEDLLVETSIDDHEVATAERYAWQRKVIKIAGEILEREIARNPSTAIRGFRAAAKARGLFNGGIRKAFEHLYVKETANEPA